MKRPDLPPAPRRIGISSVCLLLALFILVICSFASLSLEWQQIFSRDALQQTQEFLSDFYPPDLSPAFLRKLATAAMETLAMSGLGTVIAVILGAVLALPASGRMGNTARYSTRLLLNLARSIPELVWAAIVLIAAGLGPFSGCLALAAHTTGVLGRLFADVLENNPPHAQTTLQVNGANALQAFLYATLPECLPQMLSYTLYRWENNIRAAAVLGIVGAGGLGQMLKYHLSLFQLQSAATVIIVMLLMVAAVDALSFALRRWLTR